MEKRRRTWALVLSLIGVGAAAMFGLSMVLLARWSELRSATPEGAESAFNGSLAEMASPAAYVEISPEGTVHVHRELEQPAPADLRTLHMLAWEPRTARLLRIDFPFWFVRLKMSRTLNLGTLASALSRDWGNLDLQVTEDDLARRGPGLVLSHTLPNGARVLLWTQ